MTRFNSMNSIILIGMDGTGKSTLGLMSATILHKKFIDLDSLIRQSSPSLIEETNNPQQQREYQHEVILSKIEEHQKNAVIILPSSCVDHVKTMELLINLKDDHPIVHIECELHRILQYLSYLDLRSDVSKYEKFLRFYNSRLTNYRNCSNFDFFNRNFEESIIDSEFSNKNLLALKSTEQDYIKFLKFIIYGLRDEYPKLLSISPEFKSNSTSIQLLFPYVLNDELDIVELTVGGDCIEILLCLKNFNRLEMKYQDFDEFISRIRRYTDQPIILTIEDDLEELFKEGFDYLDQVLYFLQSGIRLGLEFITLNLELFDLIPIEQAKKAYEILISISGETKIIGSYLSKEKNTDFWNSAKPFLICQHCEELKCDVIQIFKKKIFQHSENIDAISFLRKYSNSSANPLPISCFNKGKLGKFSRILNPILTPVLPNLIDDSKFPIDSNDLISSEVELTNQSFQKVLYSSFLKPPLKFYVFGANVSKSLSPPMHNLGYEILGLPHEFGIYESNNIDDLKNVIKQSNFGGIGVIMPFKLKALEYVDELSIDVKRIGALNTILAVRDSSNPYVIKKTVGFNTDWVGLKWCIYSNLSPINAVTKRTTALVLGSGGMGRATIYALISLGVEKIMIWNRTDSHAKVLANFYNQQSPMQIDETGYSNEIDYEIKVLDSLDASSKPVGWNFPTIIVSCIPGINSETNKATNFEVPDQWFQHVGGGVSLETGYNPLLTPMLVKAKTLNDRGWVAVHGLSYLYAQALTQFQIFTGRPAPKQMMRKALIKHFAGNRYNDF